MDNRLNVIYSMQPVVQPVVQPVGSTGLTTDCIV